MITVTCNECLLQIDGLQEYENHARIHERGNMHDIAEAAGLKTYDTALPQKWVDDVREKTGTYPFGFVWSYDKATIWGEPYPLTRKARELLAVYNA